MNLRFTRTLVLASCAVLVACVGDPSAPAEPTPDAGPLPPEPTPDASRPPVSSLTVSVDPSAIDATYGATVGVAVTVARGTGEGDVALAVKDLPAGIEAAFAPAGLPASGGASTLSLTIGDDAPPGAVSFDVVATAAGEQATAKVTLNVEAITVEGKVTLGGAGVTVVLIDGDQRVAKTTGDGGTFMFENVKPPYDLYTVRHTDAAFAHITDHVAYYRGLTRPDPTIEAPQLASAGVVPPDNKATITGTLGGTAQDASLATPVLLAWTGSDDMLFKVAGGKSYTHEPSWKGVTVGKRAGTVYALQYDSGLNAWRGYAEGASALAAGDSATVDLTLTQPASANAAGTVTAPTGFLPPRVTAKLVLGGRSYDWGSSVPTMPFEMPIPIVPSVKATFVFSSEKDAARTEVSFSGIGAATDLSYALKEPPALSSPAAATVARVGTSFAWTRPADAVSVLRFIVGKVRYEVFTAASNATLPDIPEKRFSPDNGTWSVDVYGPMAGIDEVAGPKGRSLDGAPVRYHAHSNGTRAFVYAP